MKVNSGSEDELLCGVMKLCNNHLISRTISTSILLQWIPVTLQSHMVLIYEISIIPVYCTPYTDTDKQEIPTTLYTHVHMTVL